MAAPVPTFIQLPVDSSNTGKKLRAESRVIGLDTVLDQYVIPTISLTVTGNYFFSSTQQSVSATVQDGVSTGFFWLQMPLGSTVTALVRNIVADMSTSSTTVAPTAPVISFAKFTYSGTASGASVNPIRYQTAGLANQLIVRTIVTGMTVTVVGDIGNFTLPAVLTGAGMVGTYKDVLAPDPQAFSEGLNLEIAPGEGLVVYQSVAGTTSDPRRFGLQVRWIEIDLS